MRHIYVRRGVISGEVLVCLVVNGKKLPHIPELIEKLKKIPGFTTLVLAVNTRPGNAILGNEFITLLKDTALIYTIGGEELVYAARAISTRTYEQMFPLVGTAIIYLVLVLIFTWLQGILERRLRQSDRR